MSDNETSTVPTISASAIWALERIADSRYGRDTPALGWSVARELVGAGFVRYPTNGRGGVSITAAGQIFLKNRK
ncbi:hypothetical protein [Burkholderia sp. BCC1977]|uniref:hypothetical protein n=1 Tax=Burkholderia sp. BCC1977 TaxID=2817440 RepID=UPI002ABE45D5|nr:hypothetical protein [Burkholderia sp. BCC1977]